jgi:DNA-binding CsgD family transcriptional regulator
MEGLAGASEVGFTSGIGRNIIGLAQLAMAEDDQRQAARLFGAAESWLNPQTDLYPFERAGYQRAVEEVRARLGQHALALAWDYYRAATPQEILAALTSPAPAASERVVSSPYELTEREVEVLRLLAQGLTNSMIAERLVISLHTVSNHVRSILSKLDVHSRSAATRFAVEHQML